MKIFIFSDSHYKTAKMKEIIARNRNGADLIIHLGDNFSDAEELRNSFPEIPLVSVPGNCDSFCVNEPAEVLLNLEHLKVLVAHGHLRNVKSTYSYILNVARQKKANIVLFGHTHIPLDMYDDEIKLFNPGSISRPIFGNAPSYGTLEIKNGQYLTNVAYI